MPAGPCGRFCAGRSPVRVPLLGSAGGSGRGGGVLGGQDLASIPPTAPRCPPGPISSPPTPSQVGSGRRGHLSPRLGLGDDIKDSGARSELPALEEPRLRPPQPLSTPPSARRRRPLSRGHQEPTTRELPQPQAIHEAPQGGKGMAGRDPSFLSQKPRLHASLPPPSSLPPPFGSSCLCEPGGRSVSGTTSVVHLQGGEHRGDRGQEGGSTSPAPPSRCRP